MNLIKEIFLPTRIVQNEPFKCYQFHPKVDNGMGFRTTLKNHLGIHTKIIVVNISHIVLHLQLLGNNDFCIPIKPIF